MLLVCNCSEPPARVQAVAEAPTWRQKVVKTPEASLQYFELNHVGRRVIDFSRPPVEFPPDLYRMGPQVSGSCYKTGLNMLFPLIQAKSFINLP